MVAGHIIAGQLTRLACERHLRDREHAHARGLYFDEAAAARAIEFFRFLKHSKGEWAGTTVRLEPWQQFVVWCVFGWRHTRDGTRRFRQAYLEVARKNGKSTLCAPIGLYLLVADGEPGAEIYTAATKRDQARITHSEATRMVKASPPLRKRLRIVKDNISIPETASKFEPVGRDADSLDGLNVHGAIIDEFHAHKTRDMFDVLDTATGSRRQPLIWMITTAGFDRKTVCWQTHEYTEKVISGVLEDDSFFGIIYTLDPEDDWEDEAVWVKANPNLGVSKKWDDLRAKANKARGMPRALNAFLRLELNVWTQSATRWLQRDHWLACNTAVDVEALRGRPCYLGLDLSRRIDITAGVYVFPPAPNGDNLYRVLPRFWVPEDCIEERSKRDRVPYDAWVKAGLITATPGEVVDYDYIYDQLERDVAMFDVRRMAFDPWNSPALVARIERAGWFRKDGLLEYRQGYATLSGPSKEFEAMVRRHQLAHGNNPVLTWMADNVVISQDAAGNIKPDKEKSTERIDGIVALVMALDQASRSEGPSVYEQRGIITL